MSSNYAASFRYVADSNARVLILGSIPGRESLRVGQYYANPRNQFWKIMGTLLQFAPDAPYPDRLSALQSSGFALWDVLDSCEREGSLDASIQRDSEKANDFIAFFQSHPSVGRVYFNGSKAASSYNAHVVSKVPGVLLGTPLPSTSPAHASQSFAQKLDAWRCILD